MAKDLNGNSDGSPTPVDVDSGEIFKNGNIKMNSPTKDRSKSSLLKGSDYKKDYLEMNVLSGDSIINWTKAEQLALN